MLLCNKVSTRRIGKCKIYYMKKKTCVYNLIISLVCLPFLLSGCKKTVVLTDGFDEGELFKINSEVCTEDEMNIYLTNMANSYTETFGQEIWNTSAGDMTIEEAFKETVLAKVARIKVLNLMAEEEKVTLSGNEKKSLKKAAKAYIKSLSKEEKEALNADEDLVYMMYSEYALAEKVYNTIVKDVTMEISDDDARSITVEHIHIKTYHEDNQGRLTDYSQANKKEALERATQLREQAVTGAEFESLAAMYNEDNESVHTIRRGEMPTEYEDVAFNLDEGEISFVVTTDDGYYIIKCLSAYERKETEANKQAIIEEAKKKAFEEKYEEFLPGLVGNLNEKAWDSMTIIHDPSVTTQSFFDIYKDIMIDGK